MACIGLRWYLLIGRGDGGLVYARNSVAAFGLDGLVLEVEMKEKRRSPG